MHRETITPPMGRRLEDLMKKDADDLLDLESRSEGHGAGMAGAIALAAVVGLGVGMLAAPQAGERTRKALKNRLVSLGEEIGDGFEELEERSRPAREQIREGAGRMRKRGEKVWADLEERLERLEDRDDGHANGLVSLLTFAASLAATYLLTSEQAAPTRAKVREAATDIRRRATDQWDRFQERRHSNGGATGSTSQAEPQSGSASDI
jgi:gas vesicle protein